MQRSRRCVTGQVTQPGGLGLTDPVLHPGVVAVVLAAAAQLEVGELARACNR